MKQQKAGPLAGVVVLTAVLSFARVRVGDRMLCSWNAGRGVVATSKSAYGGLPGWVKKIKPER